MTRKLLLFAASGLLLLANSLWAQNAMEQAEGAYRQGKFSAALGLYEEELKNRPNDPFVYYNIGNCYFKMGSKGLAAANYYRAFKLAPRDSDIRHNLSFALSSGGERFVPAGMPVVLHQAFFRVVIRGAARAVFTALLDKLHAGKRMACQTQIWPRAGNSYYCIYTVRRVAVVAPYT